MTFQMVDTSVNWRGRHPHVSTKQDPDWSQLDACSMAARLVRRAQKQSMLCANTSFEWGSLKRAFTRIYIDFSLAVVKEFRVLNITDIYISFSALVDLQRVSLVSWLFNPACFWSRDKKKKWNTCCVVFETKTWQLFVIVFLCLAWNFHVLLSASWFNKKTKMFFFLDIQYLCTLIV